ncbi:MAG: hypothetical protein KC593_17145 [Myxococcales bacterium]|nr:hypothetical protein [Myxococcales bacterium]MCB9626064.1 hypothetical protein [Sandaracinaceae bacterium]
MLRCDAVRRGTAKEETNFPLHIAPDLGALPLEQITPQRIVEWVDDLQAADLYAAELARTAERQRCTNILEAALAGIISHEHARQQMAGSRLDAPHRRALRAMHARDLAQHLAGSEDACP